MIVKLSKGGKLYETTTGTFMYEYSPVQLPIIETKTLGPMVCYSITKSKYVREYGAGHLKNPDEVIVWISVSELKSLYSDPKAIFEKEGTLDGYERSN